MIIKTYTAESAAAALKMVRAELGADAVVLKTRELANGFGSDRIEITACAEKGTAEQERPAAPKPAARQVVRASFPQATAQRTAMPATPAPTARTAQPVVPVRTESTDSTSADTTRLQHLEQKVDRILVLLSKQVSFGHPQTRTQLADHDLPESFIQELMISGIDGATPLRTALTDALSSMMTQGLSLKAGESVAMLGFAGSGKTSVMGKLAAKLVFQEKQPVRLVTLDTIKVGAFEELSSYADIIGSPAVDFATAKVTVDRQSVTLIDTPAFPRQSQQLVSLREQLELLKPTYRLAVVSALTRSTDVEQLMLQLSMFNPTHVVVTMLDLTDRWGSAVAASYCSKLPICHLTNAPAGMGAIGMPDVAAFTRMLMREETHA